MFACYKVISDVNVVVSSNTSRRHDEHTVVFFPCVRYMMYMYTYIHVCVEARGQLLVVLLRCC